MANPSRFDWFFRPHLPDEDLPLSAELRFAEALAELPAIERSALALSEIGGLGTNEIAERLGTDVVVARKVLARARLTVRTTLAARGRRGLTALLPLQNWWSGGSSAPLVRTAGAVAAAVIGTGVAIGGAAADQPRPAIVSPDPPVVRALDTPRDRFVRAAPAAPALNAAASDRLQRADGSAGPAAVRPIPVQEPPPPPPLPFPTPYPAPTPVPAPVPVPVPVPVPPVELPVSPPVAPPAPPADSPVTLPTVPTLPAVPAPALPVPPLP